MFRKLDTTRSKLSLWLTWHKKSSNILCNHIQLINCASYLLYTRLTIISNCYYQLPQIYNTREVPGNNLSNSSCNKVIKNIYKTDAWCTNMSLYNAWYSWQILAHSKPVTIMCNSITVSLRKLFNLLLWQTKVGPINCPMNYWLSDSSNCMLMLLWCFTKIGRLL